MNKEEFQTKKNDINSKIRELKSQKIQLEKEYIESNAKYPIGSRLQERRETYNTYKHCSVCNCLC